MVDKILKRIEVTKQNWWTHLKKQSNISNSYKYYEIPPNLKYRYPAPGSCEPTTTDQPHLFKKHWKTPFRRSQYNIRPQEKFADWSEDQERTISHNKELDPSDPRDHELMLQYQLDKEGILSDQIDFGSEEACAYLHE